MKKSDALKVLFVLIGFGFSNGFIFLPEAFAVKLSDYHPYEYKVVFTNPECQEYPYNPPIHTVSGEELRERPRNVYCTRSDLVPAASRPESPHQHLVNWIRDPATREIFFTFLSFSNKLIAKELCNAVEERNVKIRFVLDRKTDKGMANFLLKCRYQGERSESRENRNDPEVFYRGGDGTRGSVGINHNKLVIINPQSMDGMKLAFGSANFSSGTAIHHENWNFVTTSVKSYFAKAHLCMMEGVLNHGQTKKEYDSFMEKCRKEIAAPEEEDIKVFFTPGEAGNIGNTLQNEMKKASVVKIAAHRFSYWRLIRMLHQKLQESGNLVQLILDDDLYWVGRLDREEFGSNNRGEWEKVKKLVDEGMDVRYMQTSHKDHLLHHNKFILFGTDNSSFYSVFGGAGNFTNAGVRDNFENYYLIKIPDIVDAYRNQFEHLFENLSTDEPDMPAVLVD